MDEGAPYRIRPVRRWANGDLHYLKRLASENLDKLYVRDGKTGVERLLIDPEQLKTPDGGHVSLSFCVPSPDAPLRRLRAGGRGSEQNVLHVLDTTTGKDLPGDVIDRVEADYTEPCWLPDASGFVYSRRQSCAPTRRRRRGTRRRARTCTVSGTDVEKDPLVFALDVADAPPMTETDFPSIVLTPGSHYAIGKIKHGDTPELTLYAAPLEALGTPAIAWKKICDARDEVKEFAVRGDDMYMMTAAAAPRYRVVRTSLGGRTSFGRPGEVSRKASASCGSIAVAQDALYVNLLDGGLSVAGAKSVRVARRPNRHAKLETMALPEGMSSGYPFGAEPDVDGVFVGTASWTRGRPDLRVQPRRQLLDRHRAEAAGEVRQPGGVRVARGARAEPRRRAGAAVDRPQGRPEARRLRPHTR